MADFFLSYAREDADKVERLARGLEAAGYSCWWDRNLTSGARYLKETEAELKASKAVLVIWSKASVDSHWVADEAAVGRDENRLAAVSFDGSMPPLGFRQFQVTDFSHWKGGVDEPPFERPATALARLAPLDTKAAGSEAPPMPDKRRLPFPSRRVAIVSGAVIAVAAAVAAVTFWPHSGTSASALSIPRIAFFGFTAADASPLSATTAATATEETFTDLSLYQLDVASRTATLGKNAAERLDVAAAVGARWALSGEVESASASVRVSLRLEEVPSRTTPWQLQLSTPLEYADSLAAQAAARGAFALQCLRRFDADLASADARVVATIVSVCGGPIGVGNRAASEDLVRIRPDSPGALARLSVANGGQVRYAPAAARPGIIATAGDLAERALALDPTNPPALYARALAMLYDGTTRQDMEAFIVQALETSRGRAPEDRAAAGMMSLQAGLKAGVGRSTEALYDYRLAIGQDPLNPIYSSRAARLLADAGRAGEANAMFEAAFRQTASGISWHRWIIAAVFQGAGDADRILAASRAASREYISETVSSDSVRCWTAIAEAYKATTKAGRDGGVETTASCFASGAIGPGTAFLSFAAFGAIDQALDIARGAELRLGFSDGSSELFSGPARSVRGSERFVRVVKDMGIWDYWIATGTQPDICSDPVEKAFPVCVELIKAQAGKIAR